MNKKNDMNENNRTKRVSRQKKQKAETIKRTFVLLLAVSFLTSMLLGAYIVSAGEGETSDVTTGPEGDSTVHLDDSTVVNAEEPTAPVTQEPVVSEPTSVPETPPTPDPIPASESTSEQNVTEQPEIESKSVNAPMLAAQPGQTGSYTVNWLDNDGITVLGTAVYEKGVQAPEAAVYPNGTPSEKEDENTYYTFSKWVNGGWTDETEKVYTYTAEYVSAVKMTVIWLNVDGSELDRKSFKQGGTEPGTDKVPTKAAADNVAYTFAKWDQGVSDDIAHTITHKPLFTAEYTLYLDDLKEQKLTVSVGQIPGESGLKMKDTNASEDLERYMKAVQETLKLENSVAKNRSDDTLLFVLYFTDLTAGITGETFAQDVTVTVKGEKMKDLPSNALLYRLSYVSEQDAFSAEKIAEYTPEKSESNPAESKLTFKAENAKEFCVFALVEPGEHVHKLAARPEVKATCEKDGTEAYWICEECGKLFSDSTGKTEISTPVTIQKTGHAFDKGVITKAATCTEDGEKTYKCTNAGCTETKTETIQKTGHAFDKGVITKAATCTENGVKTYTCTNPGCSETKTETISKTGHTLTAHPKKQATCTEEGYEAYWSCSQCKKLFSDSAGTKEIKTPVVIKKTDHTAGNAVIENRVEAKPGQAGSYQEVVYCTKCHNEIRRKTVEIPALPVDSLQANASIGLNDESYYLSATAENAPANASLSVSSVDPSVIKLVESSRIKKKNTDPPEYESFDVWFAVDINLGVSLNKNDPKVTITLQSDKLASLPEGAVLYHVNPNTNKVRNTAFTYSKAEGKVTFSSSDFSPFVLVVKHGSLKSSSGESREAAASNGLEGGSGVPTYYPAGDNGSGYGGYNGTGGYVGGFNDTLMAMGMNDTDVNGTKIAGFNDTKFAGENGTNTTNTTMAANVTDEGNTTDAKNETAVEKENSSGGGLSTGAVIGIIAAIVAAAAVAFGVYRYLKSGRKKEE